jgi:hypothetical protein
LARPSKANKAKAQQAKPKAKKAKRPASVRIGPFEYKITYGDIDGGRNWGRVAYGDHVIQIDDSGPPRRTVTTLMHEIFHVITQENDLLVNGNDKAEERVVNTTSMVFASVLIDNPKLRDYIIWGLTSG